MGMLSTATPVAIEGDAIKIGAIGSVKDESELCRRFIKLPGFYLQAIPYGQEICIDQFPVCLKLIQYRFGIVAIKDPAFLKSAGDIVCSF